MHSFEDLGGRTKSATVVVLCWMVTNILAAVAVALSPAGDLEQGGAAAAVLVVINAILMIASIVFVARWIRQASENAHAISSEMSISPGWAVGWYFVPVFSLFKPYEAMSEIWSASMNERGGYSARPSSVVKTWWGLWIVTNILWTASLRMDMMGAPPMVGAVADLVAAVIAVPLSYTLISMMKQIRDAQPETGVSQVFA